MLNNKGFAVTTILYTLLIAFLMFLGAALAMFSASTRVIGNANDDLINGTKLSAQQVISDCSGDNKIDDADEACWNTSDIIVKINSRYGTMYWPRNFCTNSDGTLGGCDTTGASKVNNNITVLCLTSKTGTNYGNCDGINILNMSGETSNGDESKKFLLITDTVTKQEQTLDIYNVYE